MRRLIAALGLLAFTNLTVAQTVGTCPLSGAQEHASAVPERASHHDGEHAGHGLPVGPGQQSAADAPASDTPHPSCVMVGPCGLTVVDLVAAPESSFRVQHAAGMVASSEQVPDSRTTAPDSPPPRA